MEHMKAWFCGNIERWRGPILAIGCTRALNCAHRPKNQVVRFVLMPSDDTIVGRDEDQAGTMSHTTLDNFIRYAYVVDSCASTAVWITAYGLVGAYRLFFRNFRSGGMHAATSLGDATHVM